MHEGDWPVPDHPVAVLLSQSWVVKDVRQATACRLYVGGHIKLPPLPLRVSKGTSMSSNPWQTWLQERSTAGQEG